METEAQFIARFSECWCEVESAVKLYFSGTIFNRADIPDLVQRTAICAFRKFAQFDPKQSFRAWVMGIACYEALGYMRDCGRAKVVFNSEVTDTLTAAVAAEEHTSDRREALLARAIQTLPEQSQLILKLHYQEREPLESIANKMGIAEGTLRTALCRLRMKIRDLILKLEKEECDDENS